MVRMPHTFIKVGDLLKLECRFWMTVDGEKVFGRGPCILLKNIDRLGSLNRAAKEMNMSYSKAWSIIHRAEKALGYSLLETKSGGLDGGGSSLTWEAKKLIKVYEKFLMEAEELVNKLYEERFKGV